MKRKAPGILVVIFIAVAGLAGYFLWKSTTTQKVELPVQTIVKQDITTNWKIVTTDYPGVSFKYPDLATTYIRGQQWPPQLTLTSDVFSCKESGLGINGLPGMTIQKTIGNITYCIESTTEGAAGTFYTTYTYTFQKAGELVKLGFILAYPQCDNYDEPNKINCVNERQTFDLDTLIDRIAQTIQL